MATYLTTPFATALIKWGCIGGSIGLADALTNLDATTGDLFTKPVTLAVTSVALRALAWYGGFCTFVGGLMGMCAASDRITKEKITDPSQEVRVTIGGLLGGLTIGFIIGNIF